MGHRILTRDKTSRLCQGSEVSYTQHKTDPGFSAPNWKEPNSKSHASNPLFLLPLPSPVLPSQTLITARWSAFHAREPTRFTPYDSCMLVFPWMSRNRRDRERKVLCDSCVLVFPWMSRDRRDRERKVLCRNLYDRQMAYLTGHVLSPELKGQILLLIMPLSHCACQRLPRIMQWKKEGNH